MRAHTEMHSDTENTRLADSSLRHRRHASHGMPSRSQSHWSNEKDLQRSTPAIPIPPTDAIKPPTHPLKANPLAMLSLPSSNGSNIAKSRKVLQTTSGSVPRQSSYNDLKSTRSKGQPTSLKPESKSQAAQDEIAIKKRHRRTISGYMPATERTADSLSNYANLSPTSKEKSSKAASNLVRPGSNGSSRRSDVRQGATNFTLERNDSPSHYSHGRSRRMLHLMGITRGNMRGWVQVRKDALSSWSLAHCSINTRIGSLVSEAVGEDPPEKVLVQNLRGCRVQTLLDPHVDAAILVLRPPNSAESIHLRPDDPSQADRWFAALLCWQPVEPLKSLGTQDDRPNLPAPPMSAAFNGRGLVNTRQRKDAAIIKVGKVLYLDSPESRRVTPSPTAVCGDDSESNSNSLSEAWTRVSCTLKDNGELKLHTVSTVSTLATVRLPDLTRSSVQRVHRSVFGLDYCIAICSQHARSIKGVRSRPFYLAFDSRVLYEVWFVLLRTFTTPEVYGSGWVQSSNLLSSVPLMPGFPAEINPGLFRIERSLHVHIAEAKLRQETSLMDQSTAEGAANEFASEMARFDHYYVKLLLDGQTRAITSTKPVRSLPFWYETLDVIDLAPELSHAVIQLRSRTDHNNPATKHLESVSQSSDFIYEDRLIQNNDIPVGEALIDFKHARMRKDSERWLPLVNDTGDCVGEMLIKLRVDSHVILMDREYHLLSAQLHRDAGSLTSLIAAHIPSELQKLAECLLDIYQSSGRAVEWLNGLAEEEIDGVRRDSPIAQTRTEVQLESHSMDKGESRAIIVRELNNATAAEANLLFRGNTLLSKALDYEMKRLGRDYLEGTIGQVIKTIALTDSDCEVDPNKLKAGADLQQNWQRLTSLTSELWSAISDSAPRCSPELRTIFRHIRACTDDHYGERLRSVRYSSISGFLFLRFFCPAILNPRLFGLLSENPRVNAQRTFTLIAKSLQVLANQAYFGIKEPWMEPMNQFLSAHKQQFRTFIDSICSIPPHQETPPLSTSYSTPLAMFTRLPPTSREGFPSLPYLIDHAQQFANLVDLWLDNFQNSSTTDEPINVNSFEPELLQFHKVCVALRKQSQKCLAQLDQNDKRESNLSEKWMAIAKAMEARPADFWVGAENASVMRDDHDPRDNEVRSVSRNGNPPPSSYFTNGMQSNGDVRDSLTSALSGSINSPPTHPASDEKGEHLRPSSRSGKGHGKTSDATLFGLFGRRKVR